MTRIARIWVVTAPRPTSTLGDIVFEASPESFILQVRGGLGAEDEPAFFTDPDEAHAEAERRLAAYATYHAVLDGKEGAAS